MRWNLLVVMVMAAVSLGVSGVATGGERMTPELLWELGRVGGGAISPDGESVVYTVRRYELAENKGTTDIHLAALDGSGERVLAEGLSSAGSLQWVTTPAGARIFLTTKRGEGDDLKTQVWSLDPESGEFTAVSDYDFSVGNLKVSPTGEHIAFTTNIKMDDTVNDLYPDLPKADARIIDGLMFRHWDSWHDYKYSHVHVAPIGDDGKAGEAIDLMEGLKTDCPVPPFGGSEEFAWSPDGKEIALTLKLVRNWAESTDTDIYLASADGKGGMRNITAGMNGYDKEPVYSPNGDTIAFLSMERPGFESDRNRIMLYDKSSDEIRELTVGLDQTAHSPTWSPDGSRIYFSSEQLGTDQLFSMRIKGRALRQLTGGQYNWNIRGVTPDGKTMLVGRRDMIRPWELYTMPSSGGDATRLTGVNDEHYANLDTPTVVERWVRSTDGANVHNWVIYPPNFDPKKKYPMLTYCQGGPQGQVGQWFSYRWNFHLMAANDYVIVAVNRRGLPGFGREWNDQISKDWGGQAMQDILAAHDDMLAEPYIDADRCAAIGASFGGYTAYWLMGNGDDRFATIISHAGLFNLESMYACTEELFFVNWDVGGPYWKSAELKAAYDKFSPSRFVGNWKTPLLVIHGEKDFRVPVNQGIEAFTAAQIEGIPSRFLYYPEEGHWILSPQNGVLWHRVFFEWLDRWCGDDSNTGSN